jgi:acetolactate synthase-1/2/3 large subunit
LQQALWADHPTLIEVATDPGAHPAISLYDGTLDKSATAESELV